MCHFEMIDDLYINSRDNCNDLVKIRCRLNCLKCTADYMKQQYILRQMNYEWNEYSVNCDSFCWRTLKVLPNVLQKLSRSTWPLLKCAGKCSKLRRVARTAVMSRFLHNDNTREYWELFLYLNPFTKFVSLAFFLSRGILLPHIQNNLQASSTIN